MSDLFDAESWPEYAATVQLWRGETRVSGGIRGLLVSAQEFSPDRIGLSPSGLAGGRDELAFIYEGTAIRPGDELRRLTRAGTVRHPVQAVDTWGGAAVAYVERVY